MSEVSMESRIHAHIDHLFAGVAPDARVSEIKMELYMNTTDRYHDLLAEGKSPEEAFRGATERIGDVGEILKSIGISLPQNSNEQKNDQRQSPATKTKTRRKILRTQGCHVITMFLLTFYFILSFSTSAWHITWILFLILPALENVYTAVIDLVYAKNPNELYVADEETKKLQKNLSGAIWLTVLVVYFIVSFIFSHWHLTWVIFLLGSAAQGILHIILMLTTRKEK
jgi:hypothetical protein